MAFWTAFGTGMAELIEEQLRDPNSECTRIIAYCDDTFIVEYDERGMSKYAQCYLARPSHKRPVRQGAKAVIGWFMAVWRTAEQAFGRMRR